MPDWFTNIRKIRKNSFFNLAFFLLIMLATVASLYFFMVHKESATKLQQNEMSTQEVAETIYMACEDESHRPTCYERELVTYMGPINPSNALDVIRHLRNMDQEYVFCHVAAHAVGEYAVSVDPDNWVDIMAQGPTDNMCSFGFEHGAILGRFNAEYLTGDALSYAVSELAYACEERDGFRPTELHKAMCYHGLGHVMVHMTGADVPASLDGCGQVSVKADGRDYSRVCYEGVYMQLFQPLEPEDYALLGRLDMQPKEDNIEAFCQRYSNNEDMFSICWREAWPLVLGNNWDAEKLTEQCNILTGKQNRDQCYKSGFTIHARHNLGNDKKLLQLCEDMSSPHRADCLSIAANAYIEEDPALADDAVNLCGKAESSNVADNCWSYIARTASFNYHSNSEEKNRFCQSLPKQYQAQCHSI